MPRAQGGDPVPQACSAKPQSMAISSTCRISPFAKASNIDTGMMFSRKSTTPWFCGLRGVGGDARAIERGKVHVHACAGRHQVHHDQSEDQRQRGHDLEVARVA